MATWGISDTKKVMRAMILAAGLGTRLRPITDTIPKPLVPVLGVPNAVRSILHLKRSGIKEIVINVHHLADTLMKTLGDGSDFGVAIEYSVEKELLGTGGGIKKALTLLGDSEFLVVNGDALFAPNFESILETHTRSEGLATLIVRQDEQAESFGAVGLDSSGRIQRLVYAGDENLVANNYMFTGCHVIHPDIKDRLPDNGCIVRQTYIPMIEEVLPLFGHVDSTCFFDLGTPERYLEANITLVTGKQKIDGFTPPESSVYVAHDAKIDDGAELRAGTVVCKKAHVTADAIIERSVVMPGAKIESAISNAIVTSENQIVGTELGG